MSADNRIKQGLQKVLDAVDADGEGVALDVGNYKCVRFQLATEGGAAATIKFAISESDKQPDFSSSPSYTNRYSYAEYVDYDSGNATPGSTGIVLTGTDVVQNVEINTNRIKWICPIVSGYSAGTLDMDCQAVNDYTR